MNAHIRFKPADCISYDECPQFLIFGDGAPEKIIPLLKQYHRDEDDLLDKIREVFKENNIHYDEINGWNSVEDYRYTVYEPYEYVEPLVCHIQKSTSVLGSDYGIDLSDYYSDEYKTVKIIQLDD